MIIMEKIKLDVKGMHCKSCEMLIKDVLTEQPGVKKAEALAKDNKVMVEFDAKKVSLDKIKALIKGEGYEVL
jgi:copper chaperone CopZ